MKEDGCYPCYHFYFTHTLQYVPHEVSCNTSRYNRRSCHCLPVSVKSDIRTSLIAFKPVQQCLSEAIFHLRLHIPLSLGTPA